MNKFVLVFALLPVTVCADMISPSHNCSKPATPSAFATDSEILTNDRQVRSYKQCLSDFIREQDKEAKMHSDAARKAASDLSRIGG